MTIRFAETDEDIQRCFLAMVSLRTFLKEEEFVERSRRMMDTGYRIAFVDTGAAPAPAVAGFRQQEMFHRGKSIYIDDLSTIDAFQNRGYGGKLLDFLIDYAKQLDYNSVHLDSGVQRHDAHRFYVRKGFNITSHHFTLLLKTIE